MDNLFKFKSKSMGGRILIHPPMLFVGYRFQGS